MERTRLPFQPEGSQIDLIEAINQFLVYSGPVGTGKTATLCYKANMLAIAYPGARILFLRQTKHSIGETVLVTFERDVLDRRTVKPYIGKRSHRQSYDYNNGSQIIIGGLDDETKYMSGEFDAIYIFQAEECLEEPVITLLSRLRNYVVPFQQMLLDVNPRQPNHWIKRRCDAPENKAYMLHSTLYDNLRFWDGEKWTPEGEAYLETLSGYTGHMKDRLVLGKWASPEGARFVGASRETQAFSLTRDFKSGIPPHWRRWISADWGKANPYCALWHAVDERGEVWTYKCDYQIGFEADQQAERIASLSVDDKERYEYVRVDRSMEAEGEYARPYGWDPIKGPAWLQYEREFKKHVMEDGTPKFGPMQRGIRNVHEVGFKTLDEMLRKGLWHIEIGCTALWNEIEDAVYWKDPRTGISSELVNPHNPKTQPDHALEAAVYGLCGQVATTDEPYDWQREHDARVKKQHEDRMTAIREKIMATTGERRPFQF